MRLRARGSLRAMWPGEDPCSRDRMRWVHRATCCGEAAAPQGVDRRSAEWGDQAWVRARVESRDCGPGPVEESQPLEVRIDPGERSRWAKRSRERRL
jgi:hypothetical protein